MRSLVFLQEAKAEEAIEALARMVVSEATLRRNGRQQRIPTEGLVPGDASNSLGESNVCYCVTL